MDGMSASFFSKVHQLLLNTQASDQNGISLSMDEGAARAVELILSIRSAEGKVMVIGNGGSAAIANHMHNDLCKAIKVRALTFYETPLLTAYSNDHGYEIAFEQLVKLWADRGNMLVAISSSGKSENILRAVQVALERECCVVTLSGFQADNPLRKLGNYNFYVPSLEYGCVESAHAILTHFLTDSVILSADTI